MSDSNTTEVKRRNPVEASQGTTRPKLIYVLIAGVVLVLIAFALVWGFQPHK